MARFFSRSLRALNVDGYNLSLLGLLCAAIIMGLWMAWLFGAKITLYQISSKAWVDGERMRICNSPERDKDYMGTAATVVNEHDEGLKVGAAVPQEKQARAFPGALKIVAQFPSSAALGRIRPGQKALMRLDSFPWMQYGSISATVDRVDGEVNKGYVQAELIIHPEVTSPIHLEPGLLGTVEVVTDQSTPADLILQAAGKCMAKPAGKRDFPYGSGETDGT